MQETQARFLGWEDPLEEGMATRSSTLAWRISMDRRAWWGTVYGNHRESDMTEQLRTAQCGTGELRLPMLCSPPKKVYINSWRPMMTFSSKEDYLLFSK